MHVEIHSVTVTTAADGSATAYSDQVNGLLSQIRYVKPGAASYTDGVDFTITLEDTGETLWAEQNVNASATRAPRQATHSTAGVASLYAAGGTAVNDLIAVNGRIKIVLADGGDTKAGAFHFTTI
ncbi:MAG: hypothetical protein QOH47_815 [Sphingomonadales bacterium]|jgi:hypothetical protein|nr:hypothetical protein [Sphingomonadales bacterium]